MLDGVRREPRRPCARPSCGAFRGVFIAGCFGMVCLWWLSAQIIRVLQGIARNGHETLEKQETSCFIGVSSGAGGGTRTLTYLRTADFESAR